MDATNPETKRPRGAPPIYDRDAIFPLICDDIASGITLREICRREGMPTFPIVYGWINDSEDFALRFARAREIGFEVIAESTLEIADHSSNDWMDSHDPDNPGYRFNGDHVQRAKLRIDTRLKLLAKWSPKYSDKLAIDHSGEIKTSPEPQKGILDKLDALLPKDSASDPS